MRAVPEWIGATDDAKVPKHVRARIFDRDNGVCHIAKRKILTGEPWELDHITALADGGQHRETNLAPALRDKHRQKTAVENHDRSIVTRKHEKHIGLKTGSGFRGWRRFDGTIVHREDRDRRR